MDKKFKKSTIAVHGRGRNALNQIPVNTKQLRDYQEGDKSKFIYTRYDNPTIMEIEGYVAELENSEDALVFSSGMGAISSAILSQVQSGDRILSGDTLYGGTLQFFQQVLPELGIDIDYFDSRTFSQANTLVSERTKALYIESPTNPNLKIVDLKQASAFAKKHGLISIIDNTFASPINQNPLDFGFDLVIHSGSKYLSGCSDLICGAAAGSRKLIREIWNYRKLLGTNLDPSASFLLLKGIKTLSVRISKQNDNALRIAEFLQNHPKINRVLYPGLPSHPQHETAKSQMRGYGGIITIQFSGDPDTAAKFVDNLEVILNTVSLGGVESMASIPVLTSQYGMTPEELIRAEVTDSMVRLSVGIEDCDDLIADILQSLDKL